MSAPACQQPSREATRRDGIVGASRIAIVRAIVQSLAVIAGLFLAYALLPLESGTRGNGVLLLVIGLTVFTAAVTFQVRTVLSSSDPALRAIRAMVSAIPFFLLVFASAYVVMSRNSSGSFSQPLNHVGGFYLAVTIFSTVGFGDIVPVSDAARITVAVQMLADLAVIGGLLRLLVGAVRINRQRMALDGEGARDGTQVPNLPRPPHNSQHAGPSDIHAPDPRQ